MLELIQHCSGLTKAVGIEATEAISSKQRVNIIRHSNANFLNIIILQILKKHLSSYGENEAIFTSLLRVPL